MIERHYFRDTLIKSYDFTFGFCIPGSTNTWEAVYALPPMDSDLGACPLRCELWPTSVLTHRACRLAVADIIANPYETCSDRFARSVKSANDPPNPSRRPRITQLLFRW